VSLVVVVLEISVIIELLIISKEIDAETMSDIAKKVKWTILTKKDKTVIPITKVAIEEKRESK
jgi:hypothetical protein